MWRGWSYAYCYSIYDFLLCVVPGLEPSTGVQASVVPRGAVSGDSDVFISEEAHDTPAWESDAVSVLVVEAAHSSRTQHGRDAVGLEPSVVYNDWDRGIVAFVTVFIIIAFLYVCYRFSLFCFLLKMVDGKFMVVVFSWIESCFSRVTYDDVCRPVRDACPKCCRAERTETLKETKSLAKRTLSSEVAWLSAVLSCLLISSFA